MGRSKAPPQRQAATAVPLMWGRYTLAPTKEGQRDVLQAAWIQEQLVTDDTSSYRSRKRISETDFEENDSDDDLVWDEISLPSSTATQSQSPPAVSLRRKRRVLEDSSEEEEEDDPPARKVVAAAKQKPSKRVSFAEDEVEKGQAARKKKKTPTTARRRKSSTARVVTPVAAPTEIDNSNMNVVWQCHVESGQSKEKKSQDKDETLTLRYHAALDKPWNPNETVYFVYTTTPPRMRIEIVEDNDDSKPTTLYLTSPTVLQTVLSHIFPTLADDVLSDLSTHRLVVLRFVKRDGHDNNNNNTVWTCHVGLTARALEVCQPSTLPLARRRAPRYAAALAVQSLLHTVVWGPQETNRAPSISARRVYDCTDNQQLQRAQRQGLMHTDPIPGLVPTLRGYQQAAVAWMLQRERATMLGSDEWQLAWYVVSSSASESLCVRPLVDHVSALGHGSPDRTLFFCPFAGWLATSLEEARAMMQMEQTVVRGGILAESMGLGKSVEVLACVLAHRKAVTRAASTARRKLNFDEDDVAENSMSAETVPQGSSERDAVVGNEMVEYDKDSGGKVGVVGDLSEFGDDESDEEGDVMVVEDEDTPAMTTDTGTPYTPPVPVTPDQQDTEEPVDVRWVDDDMPLGACICGQLIHLNDMRRKSAIIFCPTCNDPMHQECAAFQSSAEMSKVSSLIEYRRMFSNDKWTCRLAHDDLICPCCQNDRKKTFESRATLIVTPPAILGQWQREIRRHVNYDSFKVFVYEGVEKTCRSYGPQKTDVPSKMKGLHPRLLADNDIVLITFDVLMADLGHSDKNKYVAGEAGANLRKRKRYRIVPSPLTMIKWWRICLDEAQRVERPTAQSAQMALKLDAEYRWCVTGTPVGKGKLEDLFGLLLFLRMDPFSYRPFFDVCFNPDHPNVDLRIKHLLRDVFWRSTKKNALVREQIGIPEQIEKKVLLQFSSVERHFYDRQLERTLLTAGDVADRAKMGKKRNTKQLNLLADRLHSLRAACCHPQVGSSGIGKTKKSTGTNSLASRVMTMDEILISFIDDARLKCEEAQRLAVLHSNAMASISKLKVEAKARGISIPQSDEELLISSCKQYMESLELGEKNATPTLVLGRGVMTGSTGFMFPQGSTEGGQACLQWKLSEMPSDEMWCRVDFDGPSRRLTHFNLRPIHCVPDQVQAETSKEVQWHALRPRKCVLQVSNPAVGGEFVDVTELICPSECCEEDGLFPWISSDTFRTNKSKSWRLVIRDFHEISASSENVRYFVGLNIQLHEPDIASDPLQRLHCLHNASLSFTSLLQCQRSDTDQNNDKESTLSTPFLSYDEMEDKIQSMKKDASTIEHLYMDVARSLHKECLRRLTESAQARERQEEELSNFHSDRLVDCFEDAWWDDFLAVAHLYGSEGHKQQLYDRVSEQLDMLQGGPERGLIRFPPFRDLHGLRVALQSRIQEIRRGVGKPTGWLGTVDEETSAPIYQFREDRFRYAPGGFAACMKALCSLSSHPSDHDIYENSHCRVCKADFNQTGPKCGHCRIGDTLNELEPDRITLLLLTSIYNVLKSPVGHSLSAHVREARELEARASKFFEILEAHKREKMNAWRFWRCHLDLLNDLDELNQCKASMRLAAPGEDLSALTDDQLNAVVIPSDLNARYHDHAARQAMALGDLRRAKDTLRFLRNQTVERRNQGDSQEKDDENCMVCLAPFQEGNRAVLRCGHSFHQSPCIEKLIPSGSSEVKCPCRCRTRTKVGEVMIASSQRRDDGSRIRREIKGSWGTKVSRLVDDLLDLRDTGEKGLVFSQWEDMLDIVEEALAMNGVKYVRAKSLSKIGNSIDTFRLPEYSVMLLNVRNGAEGLTLLEATHVFMVEPLLNHGLDMQAINRIHRIGQTNKTYVHRYIMQGSVEMKIEARRLEHQEDSLEDALMEAKSTELRAGGIDGGFQSEAELMDILKIDEE